MEFRGLASCLACCECGAPIPYNPTNLCQKCLIVDIDKFIPTQVEIKHCFTCSRFLNPPSSWVAGNNKVDLLILCRKLVPQLNKFVVINMEFLYTESHSKRLKVEFHVEHKFDDFAQMEKPETNVQSFLVEYVMVPNICMGCTRSAAKDFWNASVQIRQRTSIKSTFYYLEQLMVANNATKDCLNFKHVRGGLDAMFRCKNHAASLVQFMHTKLPIKFDESKKLKSHDEQNGTFNYKYTYLVEIPPLCKNDIVVLPKQFAQKLGNMSQICVVSRMTDLIYLIDPFTARIKGIDATTYFSNPFHSIANIKSLTKFLIIESEKCPPTKPKPGENPISKKHWPADVYLCKMNNMNQTIHTKTHLGHIINAGDEVMGVDLRTLNVNNEIFENLNIENMPEIILVKKWYDRNLRRRNRRWNLKKLNIEGKKAESTTDDEDQLAFMEDLEEDEEYRRHVNIYRKDNELPVEVDEDECPTIPLEEMMNNLDLNADVDMEDFNV